MSYDIKVKAPDGSYKDFDLIAPQGTYVEGSIKSDSFNVTYNYNEVFQVMLGGTLSEILNEKVLRESVPMLQELYNKLQPVRNPYGDYWAPTLGNVKQCLNQLISIAKQYPEYTWEVI